MITPKFKISKEDLEYGKNELRQVLRDRPQMCELVKEGDPIWLFAARGFAGELSSSRLDVYKRQMVIVALTPYS